MISIVIRTKNEERWIGDVLNILFSQQCSEEFEIIIVDNKSSDKTIEKAKHIIAKKNVTNTKDIEVKIISINEYKPGGALNAGVKISRGDYIACLSAHCLPIDKFWLKNLLLNLKENVDVAGVYGRQIPMSFSSDFDKRDLSIVFGLDKKVQIKDSFFHNANSMIRRIVWEQLPFDENVSNIEDRVWAKQIIEKGYKIIYEPQAAVYHYHGIHQTGDEERCRGVVNVLKSMDIINDDNKDWLESLSRSNIVAFIPVRDGLKYLAGKPLIEYTINHAKHSKYIKETFVLTDSLEVKKLAEQCGVKVPFLRQLDTTESLDDSLKQCLEKIESQGIFPDIVAVMWITFPFRPQGYIDRLIYELVGRGWDSVVSVKPVFESCWQEKEKGQFIQMDSGNVPRDLRKKIYMGIEGLGYVTYPDCIRKGKIYSDKLGMIEVDNPISAIKVRDNDDLLLAEKIVKEWFKTDSLTGEDA